MIFGGPGKATVTGTLDGAAVDATFTRANGCEISRWERMVELGLIPKGVGGIEGRGAVPAADHPPPAADRLSRRR